MLLQIMLSKLVFYLGVLFGAQMPLPITFRCMNEHHQMASSTTSATEITTPSSMTTPSTTPTPTPTTTAPSSTTPESATTDNFELCPSNLNGNANVPCTNFGRNCYCFVKIPMIWSIGQSFCTAFGMSLIWIESENEQSMIEDHVVGSDLDRQSYWTSGVYSDTERGFRWDAPDPTMRFTKWFGGQPDQRYTCVNMNFGQTRGFWFDSDCSYGFYPICKSPLHLASNLIEVGRK